MKNLYLKIFSGVINKKNYPIDATLALLHQAQSLSILTLFIEQYLAIYSIFVEVSKNHHG